MMLALNYLNHHPGICVFLVEATVIKKQRKHFPTWVFAQCTQPNSCSTAMICYTATKNWNRSSCFCITCGQMSWRWASYLMNKTSLCKCSRKRQYFTGKQCTKTMPVFFRSEVFLRSNMSSLWFTGCCVRQAHLKVLIQTFYWLCSLNNRI